MRSAFVTKMETKLGRTQHHEPENYLPFHDQLDKCLIVLLIDAQAIDL
jgi:hypothetical protein